MNWRVLSVVGVLYAVQFIPAIFIFMALPIIMREAGHSATAIGLVQLVGLPYVLKFLWAPLIDKFALGKNRYKSWIAVLSAVHIAALLVLSLLDPAGPILPLFIVLLIAVTAVSTQDVAVDALAISLMRPQERAMGASFQSFGVYVAAVVGAFGFLQVFNQFGWATALWAQAALFAVPLLSLLLVEEPTRAANAPPVNLKRIALFFMQPRMGRWLGLLATIRLPLIFASLPIRLMMVDEGMSTEEIALWFGLIAMSAAGSAALLFGPIMTKLPRLLALNLVAMVNLGVLILVCFLAASLPDTIRYAIVVVWVAVALTDTLLLRGAMDKVRPESPGFDFSVQVALFTLLAMVANPVSGAIIDGSGYLAVFVAAALLALIPIAVLRWWFSDVDVEATAMNGETVVSTSRLQTNKTTAILDSCAQHFTEHGINCTRLDPQNLFMESMGCTVEMKALEASIDIRIETPTDNFMIFIRDEVVEHISEIDPAAAQAMTWAGGIRVGELPSNFLILQAVKRTPVFEGMMRVTLAGSDVESLATQGIHIKLMMPEQRGRKPVWPVISENGGIAWPEGDDKLHSRFVTIRNIRLDQREIDVDIAVHEGGLISDWALLEGDAQQVGVMGPGGDTVLPSTDDLIMGGDLTGLPALARLIEDSQLEQGETHLLSGYLYAAAPSQADLESYLPKSNLNITAIHPDHFAEQVVEQIRQCNATSANYGWFAGEFTSARTVRTVLTERFGLVKKSQHSMAYWKKGEPGHSP